MHANKKWNTINAYIFKDVHVYFHTVFVSKLIFNFRTSGWDGWIVPLEFHHLRSVGQEIEAEVQSAREHPACREVVYVPETLPFGGDNLATLVLGTDMELVAQETPVVETPVVETPVGVKVATPPKNNNKPDETKGSGDSESEGSEDSCLNTFIFLILFNSLNYVFSVHMCGFVLPKGCGFGFTSCLISFSLICMHAYIYKK